MHNGDCLEIALVLVLVIGRGRRPAETEGATETGAAADLIDLAGRRF